jgi:putative Mn2+ efflux pump MntP
VRVASYIGFFVMVGVGINGLRLSFEQDDQQENEQEKDEREQQPD